MKSNCQVLDNYLKIFLFRELSLLIFLGFMGIFLSQYSYIIGLINTTPDTASMLVLLTPILCTIFAIVLKIEDPPKYDKKGLAKVSGILVAVTGASIMTYNKNLKHSSAGKSIGKSPQNDTKSFGLICLCIHIVCKSTWILGQKRLVFQNAKCRWQQYPINLTAWSYFFGALWMAVASLVTVRDPAKYHIESKNVIVCLLYAIFVTSALCYVLITWCNMQVNSSFVTASWCLHVFFTVTFSYLALGETLDAKEAFGGVLIIGALLMVTWSNFKENHNILLSSKTKEQVI